MKIIKFLHSKKKRIKKKLNFLLKKNKHFEDQEKFISKNFSTLKKTKTKKK